MCVVFVCSYLCKWLPEKTRLQNDLLCVVWDVKLYLLPSCLPDIGDHRCMADFYHLCPKIKESKKEVYGIPSHSYGVSLAIWDHPVLPATRHKWAHPALTPAIQAGIRFTYPGGMEGWVDLGDLLHAEMVYPPAGGHPSKY